MSETKFQDNVQSAMKIGLKNKELPLPKRIIALPAETSDKLGYYSILNLSLSLDGLKLFFEKCGFQINSPNDLETWVLTCVEQGLLEIDAQDSRIYVIAEKDVRAYFEKQLPEEIKTEYHFAADRYFISWLTDMANELDVILPEDEKARRTFFVGPNGLLDSLAHTPQFQATFLSALFVATSWQEHLFQIQEYKEAASIVNMICFAIARQGERAFAESLLIRIIPVTNGLPNLVSRVNLATLLREESKLKPALRLYQGTILGLLKERAYRQLVMVFSEMGAIYCQNGHLFQAAICLQICSLMHGILKNGKSQAIARSQLASVYRYAKLYGLSLRASNLACNYFRANNDYLNLGRSLLTRGNVFYNLKSSAKALECYDEVISIGQKISDPQSICGALSGKARVFMLLNNLSGVKELLDEVISNRHRNSDHSVGVEYQNMGYYFELIGNFPVALVWYQKALKSFQQYMPVEVANCEKAINKLEKHLKNANHHK